MWSLVQSTQDIIQSFPGTQSSDYAKYAEALQLKRYLYSSTNHPDVIFAIISMKYVETEIHSSWNIQLQENMCIYNIKQY